MSTDTHCFKIEYLWGFIFSLFFGNPISKDQVVIYLAYTNEYYFCEILDFRMCITYDTYSHSLLNMLFSVCLFSFSYIICDLFSILSIFVVFYVDVDFIKFPNEIWVIFGGKLHPAGF